MLRGALLLGAFDGDDASSPFPHHSSLSVPFILAQTTTCSNSLGFIPIQIDKIFIFCSIAPEKTRNAAVFNHAEPE